MAVQASANAGVARALGVRGKAFRLTPGKKRASPERILHFAVADYLRLALHPSTLWTHHPAGELRDARTAAKLKRMGTKPGWPDILLVLPRGKLAGIELKADKGRLSDHQEAFRHALIVAGGEYAICRSVDEVAVALAVWGVPVRVRS